MRNRNIRESRYHREKHITMGIPCSDSPKEKRTRQTTQEMYVRGLQEDK